MSIVMVGSTSGSITLQEPAVAGSTVLTLPAVSGTVITTGSPQSQSVVQVTYASYDTAFSSTANGADIFSGSIVMGSASNRLIITASVLWSCSTNGVYLAITDGSNNIISRPSVSDGRGRYHWGSLYNIGEGTYTSFRESFTTVITPGSTGTYTVKLRVYSAGGTVYVNRNGYNANRIDDPIGISTITLMEIAA
jgi:hypothetical protein